MKFVPSGKCFLLPIWVRKRQTVIIYFSITHRTRGGWLTVVHLFLPLALLFPAGERRFFRFWKTVGFLRVHPTTWFIHEMNKKVPKTVNGCFVVRFSRKCGGGQFASSFSPRGCGYLLVVFIGKVLFSRYFEKFF